MAEESHDDIEGEEALRELELEEAAEGSRVREAAPLPSPRQAVASSGLDAGLPLGVARPMCD